MVSPTIHQPGNSITHGREPIRLKSLNHPEDEVEIVGHYKEHSGLYEARLSPARERVINQYLDSYEIAPLINTALDSNIGPILWGGSSATVLRTMDLEQAQLMIDPLGNRLDIDKMPDIEFYTVKEITPEHLDKIKAAYADTDITWEGFFDHDDPKFVATIAGREQKLELRSRLKRTTKAQMAMQLIAQESPYISEDAFTNKVIGDPWAAYLHASGVVAEAQGIKISGTSTEKQVKYIAVDDDQDSDTRAWTYFSMFNLSSLASIKEKYPDMYMNLLIGKWYERIMQMPFRALVGKYEKGQKLEKHQTPAGTGKVGRRDARRFVLDEALKMGLDISEVESMLVAKDKKFGPRKMGFWLRAVAANPEGALVDTFNEKELLADYIPEDVFLELGVGVQHKNIIHTQFADHRNKTSYRPAWELAGRLLRNEDVDGVDINLIVASIFSLSGVEGSKIDELTEKLNFPDKNPQTELTRQGWLTHGRAIENPYIDKNIVILLTERFNHIIRENLAGEYPVEGLEDINEFVSAELNKPKTIRHNVDDITKLRIPTLVKLLNDDVKSEKIESLLYDLASEYSMMKKAYERS